MNRALLVTALALVGCSSSDADSGRRALIEGDHAKAVAHLRKAARNGGEAELNELYQRALTEYGERLHKVGATEADCDAALAALEAIEGFGQDEPAEAEVLTQALVCAARHRARGGQYREAADLVVKGVRLLPGFTPDSPVLTKSLREPALDAARAGKVGEATALAQVFYGSGQEGFALSLLDLLEHAGPGPQDIYPVLRDRAQKAKTSIAAVGLAAGYATWRGHPEDATRWYGDLAATKMESGARADALKHRFKQRAEQAHWIAENSGPQCKRVAADVTATGKAPSIPSAALIAIDGGFLVAWMEGVTPPTKGAGSRVESRATSPEQTLKVLRVGLEGNPSKAVVVSEKMLAAEHAPEDDVHAAFAPKNRETSLALVRCGDAIEVTARGAPQGSWLRAVLGTDGALREAAAPVPAIGETSRLPGEDVWWNMACANDAVVHIWLADTQLMRMAWFTAGQSEEGPANLRLPGFSPYFTATGREDGATMLIWVDIMGEGLSQIVRAVIPEDHVVPVGEDSTNAAAEPLVETIEGRVEHMRLTPLGGRYALTWHPQRGDLSLRWVDVSGQPQGEVATAVPMRDDAQDVRFDASATESRLGVTWAERHTDDWGAVYFLSVDRTGEHPSRPLRLVGLTRPDVSPLVAGSQGAFAVAWVDRSTGDGEALRVAVLRCED